MKNYINNFDYNIYKLKDKNINEFISKKYKNITKNVFKQ